MMDIINIVLTCVFLCVMNTGVIFIMDKISKLMGDNMTIPIQFISDISSITLIVICSIYCTIRIAIIIISSIITHELIP